MFLNLCIRDLHRFFKGNIWVPTASNLIKSCCCCYSAYPWDPEQLHSCFLSVCGTISFDCIINVGKVVRVILLSLHIHTLHIYISVFSLHYVANRPSKIIISCIFSFQLIFSVFARKLHSLGLPVLLLDETDLILLKESLRSETFLYKLNSLCILYPVVCFGSLHTYPIL